MDDDRDAWAFNGMKRVAFRTQVPAGWKACCCVMPLGVGIEG